MDSKVRHGKLTVKYELHLGVLNYISLHLSNVVNDTDVDRLLNLHAWIHAVKSLYSSTMFILKKLKFALKHLFLKQIS